MTDPTERFEDAMERDGWRWYIVTEMIPRKSTKYWGHESGPAIDDADAREHWREQGTTPPPV